MGSIRSAAALATDYPVDNASLQRTIDLVDLYVQNSYLSGAGLAQILAEIGARMDAYGETAPPPTAAYTGTVGTATRYYAAVIEYPLAIDPPLAFPKRNVRSMPGAPLGGRTTQNIERRARYTRPSALTTVADTAALDATDYVTLTAPGYNGSVSGATYALIATDVNGALLYAVAEHVAPGATVRDIGTLSSISSGPLPAHAEFAIIPPAAATAVLTVTGIGTFQPGGILSVEVGTITAEYTPVAGDTDATIATALATEIGSVQQLVSAVANGPNITLTAKATGAAGNLTISVTRANPTVFIAAPQSLTGGTNGGPVYGPRTRVTGLAGV